jgi:RNA polymerase sigma-70 factor (sigma-E family)
MPTPEDEFTEFVRREWASLYRTAYLMLNDHGLAEDLVQSALAKTYVVWGRVRDSDSPRAYVRTTLVHTASSWFRRRGWKSELTTDTLPEPAHAELEVASGVMEALAQLPPGQRAVVVLRFHEDLSVAETARLLNLSTGTVKSQTSHALAKLRTLLATDFVPEGATHD